MKKINYKKEYLREFNLRCDYSEKMDKYRRKWLFWQPLGIVGAISLLGLVVFALVSNLNNSPNYIIYENQCNNISTSKDCQCNKINESSCNYYYVPVCNKVEVDKITWTSQDCVAHSSNNIEALNNCIFIIDKKDLNEGWLFSHGECIEYNCQGKECKRGDCHIYKIGDYEVKVE